MTRSWRFSTLIDRHKALGSNLEDLERHGHRLELFRRPPTTNMWPSAPRPALMDVSGLKKVAHHRAARRAPDRPRHHARRRQDLSRQVGLCLHAQRAPASSPTTASSTAPARTPGWSCTAPAPAMRSCTPRGAWARDVSIRFDDNLHDLSLQGPLAVDYLAKHVPGIRDLPYFHHMQTQLFGLPVMISRTGYTGERGYEIFCRGQDAVDDLGHASSTRARRMGIIPCRFTTLDMLRVESYLLFYPYDNSQKYPFDERRPRRHAVGARPRLHRQPRQDRLPRRRGALSAQGQGALQDLRRAARGHRAGRRGRARAIATASRSAWSTCAMYSPLVEEIDGHRPPRRSTLRVAGTALEMRNKSGVDQGHGAAAALRRSEEDQAQRQGLKHRRNWCREISKAAGRSSIKSRPVYGTLAAAARHGSPPHRRRFRARRRSSTSRAHAPAGFFAAAEIVFIPGGDGECVAAAEGAEAGALLRGSVDQPPRCRACARRFATAHMGLRVYLAGTEGLIGQAMLAAHRGRHRPQLDPDRASRLAGAPRAMRPLQGRHRGRDHAAGDLLALRPASSGTRSLFAPARRLPGRVHQCRGPHRGCPAARRSSDEPEQ